MRAPLLLAIWWAAVSVGCGDEPLRYRLGDDESVSVEEASREFAQYEALRSTFEVDEENCPPPFASLRCTTAAFPVVGTHGIPEGRSVAAWEAQYFIRGPQPFDIERWMDLMRELHAVPLGDGLVELLNREPRLFRFVPTSAINVGQQTFEQWRAQSEANELLRCVDNRCGIIVSMVTAMGEDIWALCEVAVNGGMTGAPETCQQIAVRRERQVWILASQGVITPPSVGSDGLDDDSISANLAPGVTVEMARRAVSNALSGRPLQLAAQVTRSGDVVGVARKRRSPVLDGFNEISTVRVQFARYPDEAESSVRLIVATTLFLSRQNTTRDIDYSRPDEHQRFTYGSVATEAVRNALRALCPDGVWDSTSDFSCRPTKAQPERATDRSPVLDPNDIAIAPGALPDFSSIVIPPLLSKPAERGADGSAIAQRDAEIQRLKGLLTKAIDALNKAGLVEQAKKLDQR